VVALAPLLRRAGRRGLLDGARTPHRVAAAEADPNTAGLEVVDLAIVLDERRAIVEVARVAELRDRRALAGVVARVRDVGLQQRGYFW
jgi:hypothetical protein